MRKFLRNSTLVSSALVRGCAYIFLRWIPGHQFPALIFTFGLIYISSFLGLLSYGIRDLEMIGHDYKKTREPPKIEEVEPITDETATDGPTTYALIGDQLKPVKRPTDMDEKGYFKGKNWHPLQPGTATDEALSKLYSHITLIYRGMPPYRRWTIVTGLPSKSAKWSVLTVLINVLLCLFTFDMTFRTSLSDGAQDLSFARVGYVSDNSAKILVREPDSSRFPIQLSYRFADPPVDNSKRARIQPGTWKYADTIPHVDDESDYTFVRTIKGLSPDTRYQFAASDKHMGFFATAPKVGEVSKRRGSTGHFTFLHSSCVKARFPYNPFADPLTVPGFSKLASALKSLKPAFMLFLGDFIYIDVPHRHGSDVDHYRREYRQVYASPEWPSVASLQSHSQSFDNYDSYSLPWLHVYDDHEIANDWDANTTGYYPAAFDPYNHYHIAANPPTYRKLDPAALANPAIPPTEKKPYFTFTQGLASFFMIDTRAYRTPPDSSDSTILGADQLSDLLTWIAKPEPRGIRWKILVSSVPFTKNWRTNAQDTWRGYLAERRVILEAMWNVNAQARRTKSGGTGIVVLSGDRHEFAATAFPPPDDNDKGWTPEATVHEFSTSPLSMFYLPVRTYMEDKNEDAVGEPDVCVKYIPDGNSKFGVVDIEPESASGQSVLKYRLFVDGVERWSHYLIAPGK